MEFLNYLLAGSSEATKTTLTSLYKKHFAQEILSEPSAGELVEIWKAKGLAAATISKLLSMYTAWHQFRYKTSADIRLVRRKVSRLISDDPKIVWTPEQAKKVLDFTFHVNKPFYEIILFLLHTGITKCELFALKWEDVDLERRSIKVYRSKVGRTRHIPLSDAVYDLLKTKYSSQTGHETVFKFLEINYPLKRICELVEVPGLSCHGLRAAFATMALEAGESPRKVSKILGHKNLSTTFRYWRLTEDKINFKHLPTRN